MAIITNSIPKISILLVDDDRICLSILSTLLRQLNHHVVAMKNPVDALEALRRKERSFDLVITDVHMPEMSGLDLLKHIKEEFKLPVVLMSADKDEDIMLKGLQEGAAFYLMKPISPNKLARIWQFVIPPIDDHQTNNNSPPPPPPPPPPPATTTTLPRILAQLEGMAEVNTNISIDDYNIDNNTDVYVNPAPMSGTNKGKCIENTTIDNTTDVYVNPAPMSGSNKGKCIGNAPLIYSGSSSGSGSAAAAPPQNKRRNEGANKEKKKDGGSSSSSPNKKPKLVWTTSLHNLFLEAVNKIGLDIAVPKKILELMNVPGLKRENVASHLQKYRIFVKKIQEATGSMQFGFPNNWNERPYRSSFVLNEITYLTHNFQHRFHEIMQYPEGRLILAQMLEQGYCNPQFMDAYIATLNSIVDTSLFADDHIQLTNNNPTTHQQQGAHQTLNNNQNTAKTLPTFQGCFQGFSAGFGFNQENNNNPQPNNNFGNTSQPTFNNNNNTYVGLRIGSNGELVSTVNNSPPSPPPPTVYHNNNNNNNGGANNFPNTMHSNGNANDVPHYQQEVNNYEMMNNNNHGNDNNNNFTTPFELENGTPFVDHFFANTDDGDNMNVSYVPNNVDQNNAANEQENSFAAMSQDMSSLNGIGEELRQLGIEFRDNNNQENYGYEYNFGSFDGQGDAEDSLFEGLLNEVISGDDDISFECFFAQEYGQMFNQQDGRIDFAKPNN